MAQLIKGRTQSLQWLSDLLAFFQNETIKIPTTYRNKVLEVKKLLNDDPSGLVVTMLDFAISSALVKYRIETNRPNLSQKLNKWLLEINSDLRKKVPTGIDALAKEYFRERWKGSSFLILRTFWEKRDGLLLPTVMYFVEGEDIKVKNNKNDVVELGDEKYAIRVSAQEKDDIKLPRAKNEDIFIQKPYESWGTREPTPFLIKRGLYRGSKFYQVLSDKGEFVVSKALEYLMVLKKGTERMALEGRSEFTYGEEDLKGIRDDLKQILMQKKTEPGVPTYTTNFDTELEHLIPEYEKILKDVLYSPTEKKLLAGLGLINIVEGVGATRRESILNPKPFMEEVKSGIKDFRSLIKDIVLEIIDKNKKSHPKFMNSKIDVSNSPVKAFMTDKFMAMLRSAYDRGRLSSRTFIEVVADMDYDLEVQRRKEEKSKGEEKVLFPPVIQNMEGQIEPTNIPDDKNGPEKKNFKQASWEEASNIFENSFGLICKKCNFEGDLYEYLDTLVYSDTYDQTVAICPGCEEELLEDDVDFGKIIGEPKDPRRNGTHHIKKKKKKTMESSEFDDPEFLVTSKEYEEAPFKTNKDLPSNVKNLPTGAKTIWRRTFNSVFEQTKNEDQARMAAWKNVKLKYKKQGNKWVKK